MPELQHGQASAGSRQSGGAIRETGNAEAKQQVEGLGPGACWEVRAAMSGQEFWRLKLLDLAQGSRFNQLRV